MVENQPLVSILIANYNNGRFFQDCYNSIVSQTYSNWEAIIVDDGSTDDSVNQIQKLIKDDKRFHLYENDKNYGCGYTKRKCVELANGEICGFLDPDDTLTEDAIEDMIVAHQENPDDSLIYSGFNYCDQNLIKIKSHQNKEVENRIMNFPYFSVFDSNAGATKLHKKNNWIGNVINRERTKDVFK